MDRSREGKSQMGFKVGVRHGDGASGDEAIAMSVLDFCLEPGRQALPNAGRGIRFIPRLDGVERLPAAFLI